MTIFSTNHAIFQRVFLHSNIHPCLVNMPLNTILLSLCSKVDFIWTCAVQLVIAQSIQFSQISKKPAIEFCQFFSYRQESLFLFNLEKSGFTELVSAVVLQKCTSPANLFPIIIMCMQGGNWNLHVNIGEAIE